MNSIFKTLAVIFTVGFFAASAFAAEASPKGNWVWTAIGRTGPHDASAKIEVKGTTVVGTVTTIRGEFPIKAGSFKDGVIAFTTEVPVEHETVVSKYEGKLEGDTIHGMIERSGRDGGPPIKVDWNAARVK